MTPSYEWHGSFICAIWLLHMNDMTPSYVRYDSFICATWPFMCVTWLIHMCNMTPTYAIWIFSLIFPHGSGLSLLFYGETWLCHMCDMTPLYLWHGSFICLARLLHICDMTPSYMWHDSFMHVTWLVHTHDMTHSNVSLVTLTYTNTLPPPSPRPIQLCPHFDSLSSPPHPSSGT